MGHLLVGQTPGLNSWVKLVSQTRGSKIILIFIDFVSRKKHGGSFSFDSIRCIKLSFKNAYLITSTKDVSRIIHQPVPSFNKYA